jgi:hypothetical protein
MTSTAARTVANVVLVSAGLGLGYLLVKNPKARRIAGGVFRAWLGAGLPAFLVSEIARAWVESAAASRAKSERAVQTVT